MATMKYYQLKNTDGYDMGIVYTNAPQTAVEGIWERVYLDELTEEERTKIEEEWGEIMNGPDDVVTILQMQGWLAERINVIDVNV